MKNIKKPSLITLVIFLAVFISCSDNGITPAEPLPPCPEESPSIYDLWPLKTGYTATYNADICYYRLSTGYGDSEQLFRQMQGRIILAVEDSRSIGYTNYYRVKRKFEIDWGHFKLVAGKGIRDTTLVDYDFADTTILKYSIVAYKDHIFWYVDSVSSLDDVENGALSPFIRGWAEDWIEFDSRIFLLDDDVFREIDSKFGTPHEYGRLMMRSLIPLVSSQEGDNYLETETYNYGNTIEFLKSGGLNLLKYQNTRGNLSPTTIELIEQSW